MSIARRVAAIAALALLAGPIGASAAMADDWSDSQNGLWYYTMANLDKVHETSDGAGITIAVFDTPINPDVAELVGTNLVVDTAVDRVVPDQCPNTSTEPGAYHGTQITALILGTGASNDPQLSTGVKGVAPGATVHYYVALAPTVTTDPKSEKILCAPGWSTFDESLVQRAIDQGADIISISGGLVGDVTTDDVLLAAQAGVIIVAAAGNEQFTQMEVPAQFNGVVAVGSLGMDLKPSSFNNYGPHLGLLAPGEQILSPHPDGGWTAHNLADGTSPATPIAAGILALGWSAHPDATANQLLQAAARTTGGTTHDLVRDDHSGFGMLNARQLVATDPTQFPDVNPFVTTDGEPTIDQLAEAVAPTPTPTATGTGTGTAEPTATPTAAPAPDEGGLPSWLVPALGAGLLVLIVGVVVAVLVARSRTPRTDPAGRT